MTRNILSPDLYIPRPTKNKIKFKILAEKRSPSVLNTTTKQNIFGNTMLTNGFASPQYQNNKTQQSSEKLQIKNDNSQIIFGKYGLTKHERF